MSAASRRRDPEPAAGLGHLTRRFLAVVRARRLSEEERGFARSLLGPQLESPFFEQSRADQRHGIEAARHVRSLGIQDRAVVTAALLHDIGKRHAGLGVAGRVVASLMIRAGLPLPRRFRAYRDHGLLAADELETLGAPGLAVEFARHHHGAKPLTIDPPTWEILLASDQPAKTRDDAEAGISSSPT